MAIWKNIYEMTDSELRNYRRRLKRQIAIRRRCMMLFMTCCLIVVCAISYHSIRSRASSSEEELNFKYYTNITVAYGETLWEIADQYIDYEQYGDKETYIAELMHINHLNEDEVIHVGRHLIVPYYSKDYVK